MERIRNLIKLAAAFACIVVPLAGCDEPESKQEVKQIEPSFRTLSADELVEFIAKLETVGIGDSWQSIEALIGPPDLEEIFMPKEIREKRGMTRDYNIKFSKSSDPDHLIDGEVLLRFDLDEKLDVLIVNLDEYQRNDALQ